jgi:hypothetical protein
VGEPLSFQKAAHHLCCFCTLHFQARHAVQYHHCEDGLREQVFVCKPILQPDRTNIVLANKTMLEWAEQFLTNRVLIMDTTFGVNRLGYPLLVVMAVDEHGCGLPICFAILKHQSELEFHHALSQLDMKLNRDCNSALIKPASYMTDCDKAEINALKCVSIPQRSKVMRYIENCSRWCSFQKCCPQKHI